MSPHQIQVPLQYDVHRRVEAWDRARNSLRLTIDFMTRLIAGIKSKTEASAPLFLPPESSLAFAHLSHLSRGPGGLLGAVAQIPLTDRLFPAVRQAIFSSPLASASYGHAYTVVATEAAASGSVGWAPVDDLQVLMHLLSDMLHYIGSTDTVAQCEAANAADHVVAFMKATNPDKFGFL